MNNSNELIMPGNSNQKIIRVHDVKKLENFSLTYGHFSTIHAGHVRYLQYAKTNSTKIAVAVIDDKVAKYPFTQEERANALALIQFIDKIILLEGNNFEDLIRKLDPQIIVLGNEYKTNDKMNMMLQNYKERGGEVRYHTGVINYASSELLNKTERDLKIEKKRIFNEVCRKNRIDESKMIDALNKCKNANLIVIGDTIVDQYVACEAIGMSAEAPVVVVKELKKRNFIGGAAVVASHVGAIGAKCSYISVVGDDDNGQFIEDRLNELGVETTLIRDKMRPTTFKKRYVVENQKLFRVSKLEEKNIDETCEKMIINELEIRAKDADGIVVSDFVYGMITPNILEVIYKLANKYSLKLFGDLQCSSQLGTIGKYKDFTLLCPNEKEARYDIQDKDVGLEQLSQKLIQKTNVMMLIMKLGAKGYIAYERTKTKYNSEQFPALSVNPVDVTGAGDSLLALMATGIAANQDFLTMASLGCCMTSLAVDRMGNMPINREELMTIVKEVKNEE